MACVVGIQLIAVHHSDHGIGAVEAIAQGVPGLAGRLLERTPDAAGALVLATCNRVEVYVDSSVDAATLAEAVRTDLSAAPGAPSPDGIPLTVLADAHAIDHLFRVTAGLDSMVVGDREVAAQVRRAVHEAQAAGSASGLLVAVAEQALRTARLVAQRTRLATRGRSVVSVALDLLRRDWPATRVLVVGAGAYAGAVVADLAERGHRSLTVHSSSGRAAVFAGRHPGVAASDRPLVDELAEADVVITCRGSGIPVLTAADVARATSDRHEQLVLVDLAITRDVEPACADLDGVLLLDLETVSRHVPDASRRDVERAQDLVRTGVAEALARLRSRAMDPAVVALRDTMQDMVADEVDRLPVGRPHPRGGRARAAPAGRAARARAERPGAPGGGRGQDGRLPHGPVGTVGLEPGTRPVLGNLEITAPVEVSAAELDEGSCPVTGLSVEDLGGAERREAI